MTLLRRKYTQEYKQEAVVLVQQSHQPVSLIAKNLGINESMLRRWVKEISEPSKKAFTGNGNPRDEELARLKRERNFLREAAAYFVKPPK
ncbi:hypothetical protein AB835_13290 [Candidatus Endobugula sertula]|uniref:Transposase n=1 Tax=Candidatus Endobugula sertula TaxID=62101 RepID=A0A1D2QLY8_9GAMM|nr:hypothetical protein AB835_13290 [Candidatus Endobugula sertula]